MRTSRIRQPGLSNMSASSTSWVEAKSTDRKPAERINSDKASRTAASSSTMMTIGCSASFLCCGNSGADFRGSCSTLMSPSIFRFLQSVCDGYEQGRGVERLAEKTADALGAAVVRDFMAAGDQKNRQFRTRLLHDV